jgi:hypothetical protein
MSDPAFEKFEKCIRCALKPETPLCCVCLHNRNTIEALRAERDALIEVYAVAVRLRTFPIPFDDHFALVGAVDVCRAVIEPPIDDYAPTSNATNVGRSDPLL